MPRTRAAGAPMPYPPRARPGGPPRRGGPPPGWNQGPRRPQPRHPRRGSAQGPPPEVLAIGAVIIITLAVGIWFFLLRGGGTSEFVTAHERFVAAEQVAEGAVAQVELFSDLEAFDATIDAQRTVMLRQVTIFNRLATEEGGDDARLASEASAAAVKVLESLDSYASAVLARSLGDAVVSSVHMRDGMAELDAVVAEWENLQ
ncbi:MAG: hypothetical protein EXQ79_08425 [Acidimicrobiia bacterium]|nr:hypothetical protein [Acidimicrobiia bacterium]